MGHIKLLHVDLIWICTLHGNISKCPRGVRERETKYVFTYSHTQCTLGLSSDKEHYVFFVSPTSFFSLNL